MINPELGPDLKYTKNMLALSLHDYPNSLSITNTLDIKIIMGMTQINRNACKEKLWKKFKIHEQKCIQDYIKWNRDQKNKNVLHLNNIKSKNTLPINKAKGDRTNTGCALLSGQIIL